MGWEPREERRSARPQPGPRPAEVGRGCSGITRGNDGSAWRGSQPPEGCAHWRPSGRQCGVPGSVWGRENTKCGSVTGSPQTKRGPGHARTTTRLPKRGPPQHKPRARGLGWEGHSPPAFPGGRQGHGNPRLGRAELARGPLPARRIRCLYRREASLQRQGEHGVVSQLVQPVVVVPELLDQHSPPGRVQQVLEETGQSGAGGTPGPTAVPGNKQKAGPHEPTAASRRAAQRARSPDPTSAHGTASVFCADGW